MNKVAIIHVENTDNLVEFAEFLSSSGWTLVSANQTEELLKKQKIPVVHEPTLVESATHLNDTANLIKQILNSRLPDPTNPIHFGEKSTENIQLVCMNLIPSIKAVSDKKSSGITKPINFYISSILRNCFVNYENLLILCDPADYKEAMIQIRTDNITNEFRSYLASKALNLVSAYDSAISHSIFSKQKIKKDFENYWMFPFQKETVLKGGANPQQKSCLYINPDDAETSAGFTKIQGKELDYKLISDISLSWEQISALYFTLKNQFSVKSTNSDGYDFITQFTPLTETVFTIAVKLKSIVGASLGKSVTESFNKTFRYDKEHIKNVTLACSSVIDETAAKEMLHSEIAAIVAPGFTNEAKQIFAENKNIRLIPTSKVSVAPYDMEPINGGLLVQTKDTKLFDHWYVKTKNRPSQYKTDQMAFGMLLVAGSRSYSAALIKDNSIIGISQCNPSTLTAIEEAYYEARRALRRNGEKEDAKIGDVLVCDSSFPFCEMVEKIIEGGVTAIIQTGGTDTDDELIQYCNDHDVVVVFTGTTHISY